jgi:hypothetical protein
MQVSISQNITELQRRIAAACDRSSRSISDIRIVAISKNFPSSSIRMAYACGLHDFGENRVQEAKGKFQELTDAELRINWHLVGHLQTNKVKNALEIFDIIHSVDTLKLAQCINDSTTKKVSILIQVNVSDEKTKTGFSDKDIMLAVKAIQKLRNIDIKGLMTIAPLVENREEVRPFFRKLRQLNTSLGLKELSMGMTDDFEIAIEEGATLIRIGRAIFGERRLI